MLKKAGKKDIKSILQKVLIAFLAVILLINAYVIVAQVLFRVKLPKVFGFGQVVVVTSSMEPTIDAGDMLIIKSQKEYEVDDIVTYSWGRGFNTHRILEIEGDTMIAKGDANNAPDEPALLSSIEGKVFLKIPKFGHLILFLKTPAGFLVLTLIAVFLLRFILSGIEFR